MTRKQWNSSKYSMENSEWIQVQNLPSSTSSLVMIFCQHKQEPGQQHEKFLDEKCNLREYTKRNHWEGPLRIIETTTMGLFQTENFKQDKHNILCCFSRRQESYACNVAHNSDKRTGERKIVMYSILNIVKDWIDAGNLGAFIHKWHKIFVIQIFKSEGK